MRRPVELHIEELVLLGFAPRDRFRIADAVERELARLLESGGLSAEARPVAMEELDGGAFRVARGAQPHSIGSRVGQSIFTALAGKVGSGKASARK
jgi:hypothetical protein